MWSRSGGDAARYGDLRRVETRRALRMHLAAKDSHVRGSMGFAQYSHLLVRMCEVCCAVRHTFGCQ